MRCETLARQPEWENPCRSLCSRAPWSARPRADALYAIECGALALVHARPCAAVQGWKQILVTTWKGCLFPQPGGVRRRTAALQSHALPRACRQEQVLVQSHHCSGAYREPGRPCPACLGLKRCSGPAHPNWWLHPACSSCQVRVGGAAWQRGRVHRCSCETGSLQPQSARRRVACQCLVWQRESKGWKQMVVRVGDRLAQLAPARAAVGVSALSRHIAPAKHALLLPPRTKN